MEIAYLADHPELIPVIAGWFQDQWGYMSPGSSVSDVEDSLRHHLHRDELPLALVALSGAEVIGSTPEELAEWLKSDLARWAKVIKDAGIKVN